MEIPAISDLLDLQDVDLEIDRLIDRRGSLPELEQYRTANADRIAAEKRRDQIAAELKSVELDLDKAEGELQILENKLDESQTRLFAGGMNARETEHKRLEVRSLEGQKEASEERVLGMLDRREELQSSLSDAQQAVAARRARETGLEEVIKVAWRDIDRELGRNEGKKTEIIQSIPRDLLEMYEQLRKTKQGVAIGRLERGQCGGCHLALSAAEQAEAATTDPPRCVHCRRMLVL
jgi:predicted  nucleic acid-binding Zn-ribbon protein